MKDILKQIEDVREQFRNELHEAKDIKILEEVKTKYLGKKGQLSNILKSMATFDGEQRKVVGQAANDAKVAVEKIYLDKKKSLESSLIDLKMSTEKIDVTIKSNNFAVGVKHPLTQTTEKIEEIFKSLGFTIEEGPEIESQYYNFEALNIPKDHPARDEQDTFYLEGNYVLRTQTSNVQIRTMEKTKPPIKMIAHGNAFRSDSPDSTHTPNFHQLEGLVIDKNISMTDLKGTLEAFAKKLFAEDTKVRFRPHFFPFTEPSAEMDATCFGCKGDGCKICKGTGYIEILGCGMVHPKVIANCGLDPKVYSGFAFGMGLERLTMLKFGISDIRYLFENDVKFLEQF